MNKPSNPSHKSTGQAAGTPKNKWLIGLAIGVVAVVLLAAIAYFVWHNLTAITKLKVEDMLVGPGKEAKTGDTLLIEYIGWVYGADRSKPFDMSGNHEVPFEFTLGKGDAIAGFDQGLVGMKIGGQRKLTIPANLAYGSKGALDGKIPPNSALVFEVELLDILTQLPELPPTTVKALKVEDKTIGTGAEAKAGKTLIVHYTGWLEDGTRFDSTRDSNRPIEFILGKGQVIAGWDQGLVGMKVGGTRKLTIPPNLGYGAEGASGYVPPNAALIFELELMEVK